ncbi:MAG: hypothetical protein R3350_05465, partial [Saprospiraceae bacterium]|nr:hypothetical protein [Saprospiraceae bacterium]
PTLLTCGGGEINWDDPKPYVIYGELFIDSCIVNIPAGTRIHIHGGVARNELFGLFNDGILYVLQNGRIRVRGTDENPVIIQGDRLEDSFRDEPGQYQGIILGKGSRGNLIENAIIKNGIFGVYVDSAASLTLRKTQLFNTSSSGLIGFHSSIKAENVLVYNNASTSVQLIHGGDYSFYYTTLASYGVNASALSLSNFFCYDDPFRCQVRRDHRLNAKFVNSIIFGTRDDELSLSDITGGSNERMFNVEFENCIVRVKDLLEEQEGLYADFFETLCQPCINADRDDPIFLDPNEDDYHLDSLSIAIGRAKPVNFPVIVEEDLAGNRRDPDNPDIGCYEFQE